MKKILIFVKEPTLPCLLLVLLLNIQLYTLITLTILHTSLNILTECVTLLLTEQALKHSQVWTWGGVKEGISSRGNVSRTVFPIWLCFEADFLALLLGALQKWGIVLFRSMSFVVEAQFVLLFSKKGACVRAWHRSHFSLPAMLVSGPIFRFVWCRELNIFFTRKSRLNSV